MKKKKVAFKKLSLYKETVVALNETEEQKVVGGCQPSVSSPCQQTYQCPSVYFVCYDTQATSCLQTNQVSFCVQCTLPYGGC
ncbi:class I lanthipeptide [Taibaiella koreensis]|uniref:class I lanthipeptide n=1 Tax=Taibaiella koreensis TaxID=1268548 RepID=UPI000E59DBFD|nr:class I lanthipeptide [Taibaiella koreensis]